MEVGMVLEWAVAVNKDFSMFRLDLLNDVRHHADAQVH